jgi:hypothetical protein
LEQQLQPVDARRCGRNSERTGKPCSDECGDDAHDDGQPERYRVATREDQAAEGPDDEPDHEHGDDARNGHAHSDLWVWLHPLGLASFVVAALLNATQGRFPGYAQRKYN